MGRGWAPPESFRIVGGCLRATCGPLRHSPSRMRPRKSWTPPSSLSLPDSANGPRVGTARIVPDSRGLLEGDVRPAPPQPVEDAAEEILDSAVVLELAGFGEWAEGGHRQN